MRRFDKTKNMRKANLLAEQRYLTSKSLIKEGEYNMDSIKSQLGDVSDEEMSNIQSALAMGETEVEPVISEGQIPEVPEALKNEIMNFLSQQRVGGAAQANDNKVAFYDWLETMWSPQDLHYGADSNEIRTNNPEAMAKYLDKKGISGKRFVK